jgi:hypothetical protein
MRTRRTLLEAITVAAVALAGWLVGSWLSRVL